MGSLCSRGIGNGMLGRPELHVRVRRRIQRGERKVLRVASRGADYKNIQAAVDAAGPGVEIVVGNGTYMESIWIAKARLTLRSASKHGAKIVAPKNKDAFGLEEDANYITLDGFDITAPGGNGVQTNRTGIKPPSSITLRSSGIVTSMTAAVAGFSSTMAIIALWSTTSSITAPRTGPWGQSGISFWQAIALDREPGFHIIVRGNILWNNSNPPKGTDGNGLIIDDFRNTQYGSTNGIYPNYTLVENNVAYHNGARGIHVYLSDHVVVRNNTAYHNNWDNTNDVTWRGELSCVNSSDVKWYNNIAVATSARKPAAPKRNKRPPCTLRGWSICPLPFVWPLGSAPSPPARPLCQGGQLADGSGARKSSVAWGAE